MDLACQGFERVLEEQIVARASGWRRKTGDVVVEVGQCLLEVLRAVSEES